jgi:hypothetical protein
VIVFFPRMINLEYTRTTHPDWRHRAWVKVGESSYALSSLQNQYALSEYEMDQSEALSSYRRWLWSQVQEKYGVVVHEMRELIYAHQAGGEVTVKVPCGALHGTVIVNALLYLASHIAPPAPVKGIDRRSPLHEPILPEGLVSTREGIDAKHIVWVTGNTQSRLGVIVGFGEVFVPGFGVFELKKFKSFKWVKPRLARSPLLQNYLNDELDKLFEKDCQYAPLEYDPAPPRGADRHEGEWIDTDEYDVNQGMALQAADGDMSDAHLLDYYAETGDIETAIEIASYEDLEEERFFKRPPIASNVSQTVIRNVYIYKGEREALKVKTPITQIVGGSARPAKKDEAQEYRRVFRAR